jgi:hypothetical protein
MNNKRRLERKKPNQAIEVFDLQSGQPLGQLANITREGLMLIGNNPSAAGTLYQLRMPLAEPANGIMAMDFGAETLWCQQPSSSDRHWIGLQIIDISPENCEAIEYISREWETTRD